MGKRTLRRIVVFFMTTPECSSESLEISDLSRGWPGTDLESSRGRVSEATDANPAELQHPTCLCRQDVQSHLQLCDGFLQFGTVLEPSKLLAQFRQQVASARDVSCRFSGAYFFFINAYRGAFHLTPPQCRRAFLL